MTDMETPENDAPESPDTGEDTAQVPDLAAELAARDEEIAALKDKAMRAAAELENTRRRLEREKADASSYAMTGFARDLLAVADNLRRALEALPTAGVDGVKGGIEATERELIAIFARHGISRIDADGQKLDPNRHQAMLEVPSADVAPGTVVATLQAGWTIKDRLLRPAMVSVAKAAE
ncbi:MAG: nucleotide exchange factor GrpE [Polymorphobacter sp.]|uniref:nucleotide exchange factor GrpE n=1 Tax=Polymorphobacter sp. TaxID=1909290 RepID=UPI003A865A2B